MTRMVIRIAGMSCGHCVNWLSQALRKVDGVTEVKVSLEGQQAEVIFDETCVASEMMADAIEKAGYCAVEFINAG